ncbi:MAG: molybdopterin-dependent oxidoreductase [Andreesenia angusta]|nr:molybdopterin-dependent oxidoreductase [Andreesenia angusta]
MMKAVKKSLQKIDGMGLVTGKPVYTDDLAPKDCLIVKCLRSPHAFAKIKDIKIDRALKVPGIECVLTWKDLPRIPYTRAGASFPEPSSYDTYILDEYVRFIGDEVAIIAGTDEETVDKAIKMIKVDYEVYEPVIDFENAIDHPSVIHPDYENYETLIPIHPDFERNITCEFEYDLGDVDKAFEESDIVFEQRTYNQAQEHAMMETYRTYTYKDMHGRLVIVSSTQVPYHVRRTVARSLGLTADQVRVIKPRIGGGFGGKQSLATEFFPAAVTMKTGKPAKIIYTRDETTLCSTTRHRMRIDVKMGANKDGMITGIDMEVLSDQGAYGEHSKTTMGPAGYKTIPLYNKADGYRFHGYTVYTNLPVAGAFRGFGVTQGIFALESAVNRLAHELGMDPTVIREKNMLREGETSMGFNLSTVGGDQEPAQVAESCGLHEALQRGKELIGWDEKYPGKQIAPNKYMGVGVALSMQGSGIPRVDSASVTVKFQEQGFFTLLLGAADIGTGSDTILRQIAADAIGVSEDRIRVYSADTDVTPFDVGAYASSTTYVSGNAAKEAGKLAREALFREAARVLKVDEDKLDFDGDVFVYQDDSEVKITLEDLGNKLTYGSTQHQIEVTGSYVPQKAASPYMACFVEVIVDTETGEVEVPNLVGVVDCGTPINPKLARVQTEGGMIQGLGLAIMEKVEYDSRGRFINSSLMEYKIPARDDMRTNVQVEFTDTYEPTGPYGAKSIGEVVLNPVPPAVQEAIYNACGIWLLELPMTPECIIKALKEKEEKEKKEA